MNYLVAQADFAETIKTASEKVDVYWWRLGGDEPNSLCRFLGVTEPELRMVLRLCKVYQGENDNFQKKHFETLMTQVGSDWTHYTPKGGKKDKYILLGKGPVMLRPKEYYDGNGVLDKFPVQDKHLLNLRSRSSKGNMPGLIAAFEKQPNDDPTCERKTSKKSPPRMTPEELFFGNVRELIHQESGKEITERSMRKLKRLFGATVESCAKDLLHQAVDKLAVSGLDWKQPASDNLKTPDRVPSNRTEPPAANLITPTVLGDRLGGEDRERGEEEEEQSTADEFIKELQEETLLQSLLQKQIHEKKQRVFELEHRNGRRLLVVCPPDTQSVSSFEGEARKHGWVEAMLNTPERRDGMLSYLAKAEQEAYNKIGKDNAPPTFNTVETMALGRLSKVNDVGLKNMRSFMKHVGNVKLEYSAKELQSIDAEVGVDRTDEIVFGKHIHEWNLTKGREKREAEAIDYWNAPLRKEVEAEVDLHLAHVFSTTRKKEMPVIDYVSPGFNKPGVTILFGGDHGDKNCPISAKINFASPQNRKQANDLNYQCPMVQFASVECSTDTYDLLSNTVMPLVKQSISDIQKGAVVTVYDAKEPSSCYRSYYVPKDIDVATVGFGRNPQTSKTVLSYAHGADKSLHGSLDLHPKLNTIPLGNLRCKLTISNFNDLFVGDLAFSAMLLGMNHSDGKHCLLCQQKYTDFNCAADELTPRTKEHLAECLEQYLVELRRIRAKGLKTKPANYREVNCKPLVDVDPQCVVVPILHCPMGLMDKILKTFKTLINYQIEKLDDQGEAARTAYKLALGQQEIHDVSLRRLENLLKISPGDANLKKAKTEAANTLKAAGKEVSRTKAILDELLHKHNAKKTSLVQQFEAIYKKHGIMREHYHGGKFNGVNCIRIMDNSIALFIGDQDEKGGFLEACLEQKADSISEETIKKHLLDYSILVGLMDAIWSKVRGIESGLLPTKEQHEQLRVAIEKGKKKWLDMGLTTAQPKWHLTFDGHLLQQAWLLGGLADKADDSIEAFHQTLMKLRTRFRGTRSCKTREVGIRRELRRKRCAKIQRVVDDYNRKIKQPANTKRAVEARERQEDKKRIKRERRDKFIAEA